MTEFQKAGYTADQIADLAHQLHVRHGRLMALFNSVPRQPDAGQHGELCHRRGHADCLAHKGMKILMGETSGD